MRYRDKTFKLLLLGTYLIGLFIITPGLVVAGANNVCPATTPLKCPDGRCVMTQTECTAATPKALKSVDSVIVPYSIDGIDANNVIEGKLKGNVTFPLKKGENKQTVTIKLNKNARKSGDKDPEFSLGELSDKRVKRGKNNSVAITLPEPKANLVEVREGVLTDKEVTVGERLRIEFGEASKFFKVNDKDKRISGLPVTTGMPEFMRLIQGPMPEYFDYAGTPTASDVGTYKVTVSAKTLWNSVERKPEDIDAELTFNITVKPKANLVVVREGVLTDKEVTVGERLRIEFGEASKFFKVNDKDKRIIGLPVTTGMPEFMKLIQGPLPEFFDYAGTPTASDVGTYKVTVSAKTLWNSVERKPEDIDAELTFNITVKPKANLVEVREGVLTDKEVTVGERLSIEFGEASKFFKVNDKDKRIIGLPVTTGMPEFMKLIQGPLPEFFDYAGTPTASDVGTYKVTVSAKTLWNSVERKAEDINAELTFNITVKPKAEQKSPVAEDCPDGFYGKDCKFKLTKTTVLLTNSTNRSGGNPTDFESVIITVTQKTTGTTTTTTTFTPPVFPPPGGGGGGGGGGFPPATEVGFCADFIDNDLDTLTDCADPDCAGDVSCGGGGGGGGFTVAPTSATTADGSPITPLGIRITTTTAGAYEETSIAGSATTAFILDTRGDGDADASPTGSFTFVDGFTGAPIAPPVVADGVLTTVYLLGGGVVYKVTLTWTNNEVAANGDASVTLEAGATDTANCGADVFSCP